MYFSAYIAYVTHWRDIYGAGVTYIAYMSLQWMSNTKYVWDVIICPSRLYLLQGQYSSIYNSIIFADVDEVSLCKEKNSIHAKSIRVSMHNWIWKGYRYTPYQSHL